MWMLSGYKTRPLTDVKINDEFDTLSAAKRAAYQIVKQEMIKRQDDDNAVKYRIVNNDLGSSLEGIKDKHSWTVMTIHANSKDE